MASIEIPTPKRGDIWLVAFGAGRIGEPAKTRPAVIMSANSQVIRTVHDLLVVVPLSSSLTASKARTVVVAKPENGLQADSVLVPQAVRGLSMSRLVRCLGEIDSQSLHRLERVLVSLLGLPISRG